VVLAAACGMTRPPLCFSIPSSSTAAVMENNYPASLQVPVR
jgi:hypothetical protein